MWQSWHWTPFFAKALPFHSVEVALTRTPWEFTASWQTPQISLIVWSSLYAPWWLPPFWKGPYLVGPGETTKLPFWGLAPSKPTMVWQRSQVTPERLGSVTPALVARLRLLAYETGEWQAVQFLASAAIEGSRAARGSTISKYWAWKSGLVKDFSWWDWKCCSTWFVWQPAHVALGQNRTGSAGGVAAPAVPSVAASANS